MKNYPLKSYKIKKLEKEIFFDFFRGLISKILEISPWAYFRVYTVHRNETRDTGKFWLNH